MSRFKTYTFVNFVNNIIVEFSKRFPIIRCHALLPTSRSYFFDTTAFVIALITQQDTETWEKETQGMPHHAAVECVYWIFLD